MQAVGLFSVLYTSSAPTPPPRFSYCTKTVRSHISLFTVRYTFTQLSELRQLCHLLTCLFQHQLDFRKEPQDEIVITRKLVRKEVNIFLFCQFPALHIVKGLLLDHGTNVHRQTYINKKTTITINIHTAVFGPSPLSVYCTGLSDVFSKHGIRYHVYAGDKQLYVDFPCAHPPPTGYPAESLT